MRVLREWILRLKGSFGGRGRDADLEEELRLHLELAAEDERRRDGGAVPDRQAAIRAGTIAQSMEAVRDQRGLPWLEEIQRDVLHGLRALRRSPLFASVALLTVAIGVGSNTAVFSVLNSVLLKPLPYPNADELLSVRLAAPGASGLASVSGDLRLSSSMYFTYAEQNRTFQSIGIWFNGSAAVTGAGDPEQVRTLGVSRGTLEALGMRPQLGRPLTDEDQQPGSPPVVMLNHGYWHRRFGGERSLVGQGIIVDGRRREIVGVMPAGFRLGGADVDVIIPMALDRSRQTLPGFAFQAVARLKPGITIDQASADITRLVPIWMRSWPMPLGANPLVYETWRIGPALRPLKQDVIGGLGSVLWVLMGSIGLVMLIACANVANLLLLRAEGRQQELAVRAALGAGRGRIARVLLIESGLLGLLGGAAGVGLAYAGLRVLVSLAPATLPRREEIGLDPAALLFALAISLVSSLLFGLIPSLKYGQPRVVEGLRAGGRGAGDSRDRHRTRNALVVVQIALALVLLVNSGLMVRTFQNLRTAEPGFVPENLQTFKIAIPASLVPEAQSVARLQQALVDRLDAIPGVSDVAFTSMLPMEGGTPNWDAVSAEGIPVAGPIPPLRLWKLVSPGLFQAAGTGLVAGRDFTWNDLHARRPVVMVSENLAEEFWGGAAQALGKRIRTVDGATWREVIGVVEDVRDNGIQEPTPATVYWPSFGDGAYRAEIATVARTVTFVMRSPRAGSESLLNEIREAVWSVNGSLPLASVRTMEEVYDQSMTRSSFAMVMLAVAGLMALALGLVGIYGVIAYSVSRRTREIGIRLALGAQPGVLKLAFVRHGLLLAGAGLAVGLGVSTVVTRAMASLLFGISPLDPATYLAGAFALILAAIVASYVPARRAAGVDPAEALKAE